MINMTTIATMFLIFQHFPKKYIRYVLEISFCNNCIHHVITTRRATLHHVICPLTDDGDVHDQGAQRGAPEVVRVAATDVSKHLCL